jgi:hypothetical protein
MNLNAEKTRNLFSISFEKNFAFCKKKIHTKYSLFDEKMSFDMIDLTAAETRPYVNRNKSTKLLHHTCF